MVGERAMEIVFSEVEMEENNWKYGTLGFSIVFWLEKFYSLKQEMLLYSGDMGILQKESHTSF